MQFQTSDIIFSRQSPTRKNIRNNNRIYLVYMQINLVISNLKIVQIGTKLKHFKELEA